MEHCRSYLRFADPLEFLIGDNVRGRSNALPFKGRELPRHHFVAEIAEQVAARSWPVVPFQFDPPTTGLAASNKNLTLLARYAFPMIRHVAFMADTPDMQSPEARWVDLNYVIRQRYWTMTLDAGRTRWRVQEKGAADPYNFQAPVDLYLSSVRKSPLSEAAFDPSQRDPLDWSSPVTCVRLIFSASPAARSHADLTMRALRSQTSRDDAPSYSVTLNWNGVYEDIGRLIDAQTVRSLPLNTPRAARRPLTYAQSFASTAGEARNATPRRGAGGGRGTPPAAPLPAVQQSLTPDGPSSGASRLSSSNSKSNALRSWSSRSSKGSGKGAPDHASLAGPSCRC